MKKILLIAALLSASSCVYQNEIVNLKAAIRAQKQTAKNSDSLKITVIDTRQNKEIIGTKEIGEDKIFISSKQNVADFFQQKIEKNLEEQGFRLGTDKQVEFRIETLKYQTKREFFIAKSSAIAIIKVTIINNKTQTRFYKNYNLSLGNKHFIMPLESTDGKIINSLLQEIFVEILGDLIFIDALNS